MSVELRVLSYNVRSLRDDRRAVARTIRACAADVVCIQEAPRLLRWRSSCARLARESGLVAVTGGRTAGGTLLLCDLRLQVLRAGDVLLSKRPRLHQRGLAVGVFSVRGRRVAVASVHLGLAEVERRRHVDEIFEQLAAFADVPVVLAGDVNERPGEPAWAALTARLQDGYAVAPAGDGNTYSAASPHRRIDGIFVDRRLEVVSCGVPDRPDRLDLERGSDHRPLLAVVRVPDPPG